MTKRSWVILELSSRGEEEARSGRLTSILKDISGFSSSDIYVPVVIIGTGEPLVLLEGYCFIRTGYPSDKYWDLAYGEFVRSVISDVDPSTKMISKGTITDQELRSMLKQTDQLGGRYEVGTNVKIKQGYFKGLEGLIIDLIAPYKEGSASLEEGFVVEKETLTQYVIEIKLRSADVLVSLDCFSFEGV